MADKAYTFDNSEGTAAIAVPVHGGSVTVAVGEKKTCMPKGDFVDAKANVLKGLNIKVAPATSTEAKDPEHPTAPKPVEPKK